MNKPEALKKIVAEAKLGELTFPTNVHATLKIQEALNDPECGIEAASKLVMQDPIVAVRVVAIANSIAYSRFGGGVTNVRTAITILGFNTLRSVVVAVAMRQINQAIKNPKIRAKMELLWQHSAHVAAMSHLLARKVSKIDPETALFAGIVHEIGGFYLLARADEFPSLQENHDCAIEDELDEDHEIYIGRAVLRQLLVPKRVVTAIETLWYGTLAMPPETLGDTLLLANELTTLASPLDNRSENIIAETAASIDCELEGSTLRQILHDSTDDLHSLVASLIH
ncbi:HDOD domain-containing protein [Undibacterium sp. SXout20W]|uniref:HDOD domain-containing protein n=1 Tax=Undibacterium sp. SXout20W TaxID=3413051 RepID=UPI003BF436FC